MIIKKSIQLTSSSLDILIKNKESIDFRLDELVWKDLKRGDFIEFWEDFSGWDKSPSEDSRLVQVEIVDIFRADTFSDLIDNLPLSFVVNKDKESLLQGLHKWWPPEKAIESGVLAWKVQIK